MPEIKRPTAAPVDTNAFEASDISNTLAFRNSAVMIPQGAEREALLQRLSQMSVDGSGGDELKEYLESDLDHFLYTLAMLAANARGRGLEVDDNPYFMSILAREQRAGLEFDYINYFDRSPDVIRQGVRWPSSEGSVTQVEFGSNDVNLKRDVLRVPDESYDIILFCKLLKHFTMYSLGVEPVAESGGSSGPATTEPGAVRERRRASGWSQSL